MQKHCTSKFCHGLVANTLVYGLAVLVEGRWGPGELGNTQHSWAFRHLSWCLTVVVRDYCCSPSPAVHKSNTFLIPHFCSHDFTSWWHTPEFLLIWGFSYRAIPSNATLIQVQSSGPSLVIPRSVPTGCHECWQQQTKRQQKEQLPAVNCHGGWNLGPPGYTQIQAAIDSMAPHNIPNEEEIQECAISRKIHGHSLLG